MTTPPIAFMAGKSRFQRAAGLAGVLAPVAWAVVAAIEVTQSNIGHSLISRPERFFSNSTWHWPLVLVVSAMGILEAAVCLGLAMRVASPRLRWAALGPVPALLGLRFLFAIQMPSDPGGYGVSGPAATTAWLVLVFVPMGLVAAAVAVRRRGPGLAWLSAGLAVAMVVVSTWAIAWAARSAPEPQLLAIEPVEGLAALWSAAVGCWLLGWSSSLDFDRRWPIPAPGRRASVALALAAIVGVVGASGSFVQSFGPTIANQLTGRTTVERMQADAVERTYRVYRPQNPTTKPGLVVVLHGSFGSGFQAETATGFDAQADRLGWIAVYPDGVADGWDAFGSGPTWGQHPGADDVVFIRQLITSIEASDGVDPDRVYVTGQSRGGMMTYRLGCVLSATVAAIAPVSGNTATASGSADVPCPIARPVSVLAIHGTADGTIPMAGGKVDIIFSPMADVIARWRSLDGCSEQSTVAVDGAATTTAWACSGGSAVSTRIIDGGCHCWPSDASRVIADFFVAHPRVPAGG
jgi:polyhydroxybutyrate depolymerase